MTSPDDYAALREGAITGAIAERRQIAVSGPDRASFLQGFLTNDIPALTAGRGCYAAWLTPQGRMLTDLHVLESGDMLLLDVPAGDAEQTAERLEQFHFTEDVQIASLAGSLRSVWLHGPLASQILTRVAARKGPPCDASHGSPHSDGDAQGDGGFAAWANYQNTRTEIAGTPVVVARIDQLGVPGYVIYVDVQLEAALTASLASAGAVPATPQTLEAAPSKRISLFVSPCADTIPLESAIGPGESRLQRRYWGRMIVRGCLASTVASLAACRPAWRCCLRIAPDLRWRSEFGSVTSAAHSPRFGAIRCHVHRDFIEPVPWSTSAPRARAPVSRLINS